MEKDQSKEENESRKEYLKLENLGNMVREKVFGWNERKSERERCSRSRSPTIRKNCLG
jgi:hypothetical protein